MSRSLKLVDEEDAKRETKDTACDFHPLRKVHISHVAAFLQVTITDPVSMASMIVGFDIDSLLTSDP
jgi:hypothetical protein